MNKLIVILLEPAPYHYDLWNEFVRQTHPESVKVIFTEAKDRLPDSGHDFRSFPERHFKALFLDNKNLFSTLSAICILTKEILFSKDNLFFLASYHKIQTFYSLILLFLLRKKYFFSIDRPNISLSHSIIDRCKRVCAYLPRFMISASSYSILTCGSRAVSDSIIAFNRTLRIYNFPYVVSRDRIQRDASSYVPRLNTSTVRTILFSGRLIPRKGFSLLLVACSNIPKDIPWRLLVEGDGPDYESCLSMVKQLGLSSYVSFLGFSQYRQHSYYLSISDIVIVPSYQDNWGIVVDEALQLGKVVLASRSVGSASELIVNNKNGLLFDTGDSSHLHQLLVNVLSLNNDQFSSFLPLRFAPSLNTPQINVATLKKLISAS